MEINTSGSIEEFTIERSTFWRDLFRKKPLVEVYITSDSGLNWYERTTMEPVNLEILMTLVPLYHKFKRDIEYLKRETDKMDIMFQDPHRFFRSKK